ncbi:hypothetical protein ACPV5V_19255 [Vibrio campbellii]|nr:hypothetical protein [Vibrio parahaemolyticus]HCG7352121.1 hypothetical protein [Vibrio parahaemolyticus]
MARDITVTKSTSSKTRPEQVKIGQVYEAAENEAGGNGEASVVVVEVVEVVEVTVWAGIEQNQNVSTKKVLQLLHGLED